MPGQGKARGGPMGRDGGRGDGGARGADRDGGRPGGGMRENVEHGRPDTPGRSEQSPGHMKRDAGEQSARDFAPGHRDRDMDQVDRSVVPGDSPNDVTPLS